MSDFLSFRRMFVPVLIRAVFIIGTICFVLVGAIMVANKQAVLGLAVMFGGPIALRVTCELLTVLFAIQDTLADIRDGER
jgi:hypothetical protein